MKKFSNDEIIRGILENDEKVIRYIYEENYKKIEYLVLTNNGISEEAADVFQETMIIIYNKIRNKSLTLTAHFDTYLYGVAKLIWLAQLRKKNTHIPHELMKEKLMTDEDIFSQLIQNEKFQLVWHYFHKLTEDCKKVIQLFFEGNSIKEITKIMNYSSEQHTKNRRLRCKERLIQMISKDPKFKELIQPTLKTGLKDN